MALEELAATLNKNSRKNRSRVRNLLSLYYTTKIKYSVN